MSQPYVSVVTLACDNAAASRRFYAEGFGWEPVFEADEIAFYQLNGLLLGLFRREEFASDMSIETMGASGGFALAHNVRNEGDVAVLMNKLVEAGGKIIRSADAPSHGGLRGYVADPDGHPWEIAWNPHLPLDGEGNVSFPIGV